MSVPTVKTLLLPVLQITKDRSEHSVNEVRELIKEQFKLTPDELSQIHPSSGINVFVNRIAWALAHLVMGKAIVLGEKGYRITERGLKILMENPSELTIRQLH
jgi:restriction system protein